ncbi:universal stress protein [Halopenitus salinus]|uniref:Universal stress protein n=1 Tax=Halopenitus salinus TaxID=1198295 RepID=A0ABD5UPK7_9EURY
MYHVLLAVDDDERRSTRLANAVAELPDADENVFVSVFHCFVDNPAGVSAPQVGGIRRVIDALEEAGVDHEVLEASGDPAESILRAADDEDVDVIYVAGRSRSPAGKALFGSVAQSVILGADRPVTIVGRAGGE